MSKYQTLIDALKAPSLTDCPWESCGPSRGAALPVYCNEVVAAPEDIDDDVSGEVICRAPLGLELACTADMNYIAAANPATIRSLLADLERAEKDAERYRFLAEHCRSTSEHWGGRWSIVVEGPAPKTHDSEDEFDAAIDAAISQIAGGGEG